MRLFIISLVFSLLFSGCQRRPFVSSISANGKYRCVVFDKSDFLSTSHSYYLTIVRQNTGQELDGPGYLYYLDSIRIESDDLIFAWGENNLTITTSQKSKLRHTITATFNEADQQWTSDHN